MISRLRQSRLFRLDLGLLPWIVLLGLMLLVVLTVLLPYYGTGMNYPYTPPGWQPDRPDEYASIAHFAGTIWEQTFWREVFWNVGCSGWCWWIPALLLAGGELFLRDHTLSPAGRRFRRIALILVLLLGCLWFVTAFNLISEAVD